MKTTQGTCHSSQIDQLKRVEGQVRGIIKMIEDQRYCVDILNQIKAVRSSLVSVEKKVLNQHLDHCVHKAVESPDPQNAQEMIQEIKDILQSVKL